MRYRSVLLMRVVCASVFLILLSSSASAQVVNREKGSDAWEFYVAPYFWAASIEGTSAISDPFGGAPELPIDLNFSDLSEALDFAFQIFATVKKDRWSVSIDLSHLELSSDQSFDVPPPPPGATATITIELTIDDYELLAGYQMNDDTTARVFDLIFGLRYIDQEIKTIAPAGAPPVLNLTRGDDWVDPFVGVRYYGPFSKRWFMIARADVGGFGIGSDVAARLNGGVGYIFPKLVDISLQYKILRMNYSSGTPGFPDYYKWDAVEHGLLLGVGFRF